MNTENNKLIAEFMKFDFSRFSNDGIIEFPNDSFFEFQYNTFTLEELKFHSDWNWLMEVVEKIEELEYTVNIYKTPNTGVNYCEVNEPTQSGERCKSFQHSRESKIQAVYIACVEFIKWYNQQK